VKLALPDLQAQLEPLEPLVLLAKLVLKVSKESKAIRATKDLLGQLVLLVLPEPLVRKGHKVFKAKLVRRGQRGHRDLKVSRVYKVSKALACRSWERLQANLNCQPQAMMVMLI
jgi:hypothetical protein